MPDLFSLDVFPDIIQVSDGDSQIIIEEPTNGRTVEEILSKKYELRQFVDYVNDDRDVGRGSGGAPENRFPEPPLPPDGEGIDPASPAGGRGGEV